MGSIFASLILAALYIVSPDGESLVPVFLAEQGPPLFVLSAQEKEEIGNDGRRLASFLQLAQMPEDDGMLWECLRASASRWLMDSRTYPGIEVDEVMLAPIPSRPAFGFTGPMCPRGS